jgi:hypothetical protein
MPIPGVKLSGFLGRRGKIASVLRAELEESAAVKRTKLARLTELDPSKMESHKRFIRRAIVAERIAELAGATWNAQAKSFESKKRTS